MAQYFDMKTVLDSGTTSAKPSIMGFGDDNALFYAGRVNTIFGDPESGKTWVALAAVADELSKGHRATYIDIDHNGAQAIGTNLLKLGADYDAVIDQERFRVTTPNDHIEFDALVADLVAWEPHLVVLDSMGELLPIFGASSNDSDDFTTVNRRAFTPLIVAGAGVICVDHLAKGSDSRGFGPTGTMAKRRITGGSMLRITVSEPFAPGRGGKAHLNVFKDRHGGVRSQVAHDKTREPLIGEFVLSEDDGVMSWSVEPRATVLPPRPVKVDLHEVRVQQLLNADRLPASISEAKSFLRCSQENAKNALKTAREALNHKQDAAA